MTPDPKDGSASPYNPQSWNRYPYANNDPVDNSDPDGTDATCGNGTWTGEGCSGASGFNASAPTSGINPYAVYTSNGTQVNTGSTLGTQSSELLSAYNTYVSGVQAQWAANHANLLIAIFGLSSQQYTDYMGQHPELTTSVQVNPNFSFSGPQMQVLAYLYAAGLFDYIATVQQSKDHPDGLTLVWIPGSEDAVNAILYGPSFDHGALGALHTNEVGPNTDFRSWAFGADSLQITWGTAGVYADNDVFNPYNPVGFVLHGIFEVIPPYLHLPQPKP